MKGLLIALGKPGKESSKDDSCREYAREAFGAIKDDDEEGFIEAFMAAVEAAKSKSEPDEDD